MAKSYTDKTTYIGKVGSMMINPYVKVPVMEEYDALCDIWRKFQEYRESANDETDFDETDFDKYIRYASLVFDPSSPLIKQYSDIKTRRERASKEIGYGGYDRRQIEVFLLQDVYRSSDWTLICSIDNHFAELTEKVNKIVEMSNDPDKELKAVEFKGKMIEQMGKLITTRKELIREFFGGDQELEEMTVSASAEQWIRNVRKRPVNV